MEYKEKRNMIDMMQGEFNRSCVSQDSRLTDILNAAHKLRVTGFEQGLTPIAYLIGVNLYRYIVANAPKWNVYPFDVEFITLFGLSINIDYNDEWNLSIVFEEHLINFQYLKELEVGKDETNH